MDFLFPQKNAPLILSRHLRQLIQQIGQTKTKEHESRIITQQISIVKQQLQHHVNPSDYPDIIVKLIYFQTLGYNTSFARILPINLCQSQSPYLKKISYLLSGMLVKPGEKLALLMHNTIVKDLTSENVFTNLTVLSMLRYFLDQDLANDVLTILRKLLKNKLGMVRRKSLFVLYHIYQKFPHLIQDIKQDILTALNDSDIPTMFGAVCVIKDMIDKQKYQFKQQTSKFVQILDKIMDHKYPPEYDYHRIPAPWLQITLLQILQKLGKNDQNNSAIMYDVLDKCILQQCIKTISNIYPHQYLLQESEQALSSFFTQGNNNNIKSFGLYAMTQLARGRPQVLQKWKLFLVECLESEDITLAERTIGLLIEIADENNTEIILKKIIVLAEGSTDTQQKRKLIKSSIYLIERFSDSKQVFMRRMNQIFYKFQEFVSQGSINNYLKTLQEMVQLDEELVNLLVETYIEIILNFRNNALVKVSVWIIGEMTHKLYLRDKNSEAVDKSVDAILNCAEQYITNQSIIFTIIISLMKLSPIQMTSRHEEIKNFLLKVESQQSFAIHKSGEQFIRIAKYGKALYASNQLQFDPKMRFLSTYLQNNYVPNSPTKRYLITKKKSQRAQMNELDLLSNDTNKLERGNSNIYEFKPGHRWGQNHQQQSQQQQQQQQQQQVPPKIQAVVPPPRKQSQSKMILRGPHQQKKSKQAPDQKKMKLAMDIFGKKK